MPHLKLFKRTWKYAEDEFVISNITQAIIRTALVATAGGLLLSPGETNKCPLPSCRPILIVTSVLCILQILLLFIVAAVSGNGGVMEVHKRKRIGVWIAIHLCLMCLELIFYCLSIWQISSSPKQPSSIAVICWCSILLFVIVFEIIDWIRHYDRHGKIKYEFYQTFLYDGLQKTDREKRELIKSIRKISHTRWETFIQEKLTSYEVGDEDGKEDAIIAVASALSDLVADLDLTLSDLATGLILLRWQSNMWIGGQSRVPAEYVLQQTEPVLDDIAGELDPKVKNPADKLKKNWLHISRLRRYAHLVNASYGWIYYYIENPCDCKAINRLCQKISCSNPEAPSIQIDLERGISGPGGCLCAGRNCYLAAFLEMSQLECENILVFEITDKFYNAAVMLVIDDVTEAIVLIVRGTLSGDDTLVDMIAAGEPLLDEDSGKSSKGQLIAHSGMARTARNISQRVVKERWFEEAKRLRPNYPAVICGHSLGAGLVSLMCVLLKPHYPELKAYAFSPPGGLMSKDLAKMTRKYLCSITYGYDCVGRLGSHTLEDLRARVFHALCIYKTPKFMALGSQMCFKFLRLLPFCSRLPKIIKLDEETMEKLVDPDMHDAYETPIGSKFKPHLKDRIFCETRINRLLPSKRSLMRWKDPKCTRLLTLSRPYPRSLYPKTLREPSQKRHYTLDLMMESMIQAIPSGRLLHIIEVDKDFEIEGVQPYTKRGYTPPPIALWADAENFNSLLIHPKMLFNHSPIYVSTALDRLYNSIMHPEKVYHKIHVNTWDKEMKPVSGVERKITEKDVKQYCRVRKLK